MPISSTPISSTPISALVSGGEPGTPVLVQASLPRARQVLLVGDPRNPRVQRTERVYISSHGYRSLGDGAGLLAGIPDHTLFPSGIGESSSISVSVLSGGEISTAGITGLGEVRIANVRRRFDHLLRLEWNRRPVNLYVIERHWSGPSWALARQRLAATVERIRLEDDDLVLVLRDRRSVLEKEVNAETYRGLGAAIRFDGSDDEGTLPIEVGNVGSGWLVAEMVLRWQPGSLPVAAAELLLQKRAGAGSGLVFQLRTDGRIQAFLQDAGGTSASAFADYDGLDDGELHSLAMVRDPDASEVRILIDGNVAGTAPAALGSITSSLTLGVGGRSGASNLSADIAQLRIWRGSRTDAEILAWDRRPLDSEQKGRTWIYIPADEGSGTTAFEEGGGRRRRGLRFVASPTGRVDFPSIPDPGSGPFTARFEVYFDVGGVLHTVGSKASTPSSAGWDLFRLASDVLQLRVHNGTSGVTANTAAIETRRVYRIVVRLDPTSGQAEIWLDGELAAAVSYTGSIASAGGFRIGQHGSNGGQLQGTVYEADIFSVGLSPEAIAQDQDPDSADFALELWAQFDETSGTSVPDSSVHGRDGTIAGTGTWISADLILSGGPKWVGSLEGGADLAGKRKQRIWGERRHLEGEVVDAQNAVVQFAANACQSIVPHLDGLASLIADGDSTDIYAADPIAGHYRTDLSRGLARFNALPDGGGNGSVLTANIEGDNEGGYETRGPEIMRRIAIREGGLDEFDEVEAFRFTAAAAARPGIVGLNTGREAMTVAQALNDLARTSDAFWLIDPRTGKLDIDLRVLPSGQHDHEIDLAKRLVGPLRASEGARPSSGWRIGYEQHGRVFSLDEIAGAASAAQKQSLLEAVRLAATGEDSDVVGRFEDHAPREFESRYVLAEDAEEEAARRQTVDRIPHLVREAELIDDGTFYRVGERVLVTGEEYGLDDGLRLVIGSVDEDGSADTVTLGLWGPATRLDATWARVGQQEYGSAARLFWQPAHGLLPGEVVRRTSGTGWVRARADSEADLATGIVAETLSSEVLSVLMGPAFVVVPQSVLAAFAVGDAAYLSQSTPGALDAAPGSGLSQQLGTVVAATVLRWKRRGGEVV